MHYQVYRPLLSTYQGQHFCQQEKSVLESLNKQTANAGDVSITYEVDFSGQTANPDSQIILITNTQTKLEDLSETLSKRLALIIHPNSGYDNLNVDWIKKWNVPVVLGNPIRAEAVSEYVLSCLFHRFTQLPIQTHWSKDRLWPRDLLKNQRVLLLGLGHVGRILAPTLMLLCKKLTIYDPYLGTNELPLTESDIVIVACDLNPTSTNLINKSFLEKLPTNFTLINPARGPIVCESSLLEHLRLHKDATAYLDVFQQEPYPGAFPNLKNLICTSHQAGVFAELDKKILQFEQDVLSDFIQLSLEEFKKKYHYQLLENKKYYERMGPVC